MEKEIKQTKWPVWCQNLLISVIINAILFFVIVRICPPVFNTNDDYRMRLIVSGAYTGTPNSEIVFMYRWIGVVLSKLYILKATFNWYACLILGSIFLPCCILLYHMLESANEKSQYKMLVIYLIVFLLAFQKHITIPQFTVCSAFLFFGMLILEVRLFNISSKTQRKIEGTVLLFCGMMSMSIREKVFLMLFPASILLFLAKIFWRKKEKYFADIKKNYKALVVCISVFCSLFIVQRLMISGNDYQEYVRFNVARSKVFDYYGVPDYDSNQEFYESIGMSKASWHALSARMFDVSDEINADNLEKIASYSKEIDDKTFIEKFASAIEDIYNQMTSTEVKTQFFAVLFIAFLVFCMNNRMQDRRYSYLFCLLVAYTISVLIFFGIKGRIMPRIVEAQDLMLIVSGILILLEMIKGGPFEDENVFQYLFIWKVVQVIGIGIISCSILLYNLCWFSREDSLYHVLISNKELMESLQQYAQERSDMYIFYNAWDFIGGSALLLDAWDGSFSRIDSLGNWNAESVTWKERNALLNSETAIDALCEDTNVYYAEKNDYHAEITELLLERNKRLEWCDSYSQGSNVINIYHVVDNN